MKHCDGQMLLLVTRFRALKDMRMRMRARSRFPNVNII